MACSRKLPSCSPSTYMCTLTTSPSLKPSCLPSRRSSALRRALRSARCSSALAGWLRNATRSPHGCCASARPSTFRQRMAPRRPPSWRKPKPPGRRPFLNGLVPKLRRLRRVRRSCATRPIRVGQSRQTGWMIATKTMTTTVMARQGVARLLSASSVHRASASDSGRRPSGRRRLRQTRPRARPSSLRPATRLRTSIYPTLTRIELTR
mmetsp:Transcript_29659/g.91010  ORF Transcript_29659/g.91010 Transcript_29659/m.91010 type:complete len:208 (-) Transcript_29659:357-980(-)